MQCSRRDLLRRMMGRMPEQSTAPRIEVFPGLPPVEMVAFPDEGAYRESIQAEVERLGLTMADLGDAE